MSSTAANGSHVLVYPLPSLGHVIPLLDLTHRLLTRGLRVTVLVTPKYFALLQPLISTYSSSSLQTLVGPIPETSPLGLIKAMREHHEPVLIKWFESSKATLTPPVVAIISDFLIGWTHEFAGRIGVKRIVFSPSGALEQSATFALWKYLPKKDNPNDDDDSSPISFTNIPNSPIYPWWQIPSLYRTGKEGDPDWEYFRSINLINMVGWAIVFNSFAKLEGLYFDHLKREVGHDRVWAVGPLFPDPDKVETFHRGGTSSLPRQQLKAWLDCRPDNSVVYVCFGTQTKLTSTQMEVLTAALEQSRIHFIFCMREHDGKNVGEVPDGFDERVRDRGLVIRGWAPQVAILNHRALGAFLTHCGWNSVVEGLAAGVVMLAWPIQYDQFTNAKLVVEQSGAGIRVGEGTRTIPDPGELARWLDGSLEGSNETEKVRLRAKELSRAVMEALAEGGSSGEDLDELVNRLNELPT